MKKLLLFGFAFIFLLAANQAKTADKPRHALPQCLRINMDAAPTVGYAPLFVRFNSLTETAGVAYLWDFGDGNTGTGRNPIHRYENPGTYSIKLTLTRGEELSIMEYEDLITVYDDSTYRGRCNLKIVEHSHTYPKEGWDNSIDGDVYKESGTTTAGQDPAWVIYAFEDEKTLTIDKVRLIVRTETKMKSNWINRFRLSISTTGTYFTEFHPVLEADRTTTEWEEFKFEPVKAKYVKLEIIDPYEKWCQIGEFEIYENFTIPDVSNSSFSVAASCQADSLDACAVEIQLADSSGAPVSGLPSSAFRIISSGGLFAQNMVTETDVPGTYTGSIQSFYPGEKEINVKIYGEKIGSPQNTTFYEPKYQYAQLEFIHGTECLNEMGWENAIDGNWEDAEGTTWAGPRFDSAWGIFQFSDSSAHSINKIRAITDTGIGRMSNLTTIYQIWISDTDTAATSFKLFHEAVKDGGGWEEYKFLPTEAKYIKLILPEPHQNYRLFGELEIYSPAETIYSNRRPQITSEKIFSEPYSDKKVADSFILSSNYPNPFNPETRFVYELGNSGQITFLIFNLRGQIVRRLFSENRTAGHYELTWDGRNDQGQILPSGNYWCRIQLRSGNQIQTRSIKMTLLK